MTAHIPCLEVEFLECVAQEFLQRNGFAGDDIDMAGIACEEVTMSFAETTGNVPTRSNVVIGDW